MSKQILDKYAIPNKLTKEPYGTVYRVLTGDSEKRYYIQISSEENLPHWESLGDFFETTFEEFIHQDDFLQDCLRIHKYKLLKDFNNVGDLLKE
jgi:hypothetical protein